ncbi:MAG: fructose-bisphosphatase class II [Pseudomonadota bacterium]
MFADRMPLLGLAGVSEIAAFASAKMISSGDENVADQTAFDAIRPRLNQPATGPTVSPRACRAT